MASPRIGVVGLPGKWSSEVLADAVHARTGFRLLVDMQKVCLDLQGGRLIFADQDLCELDALVVKKITAEYAPDTLDYLELLRMAQARGVRVFSDPERILRLINRLSCTVSLAAAGIPMPETRITADPVAACDAVEAFGQVVLKPLFSTKARGMQLLSADDGRSAIERQVQEFHAGNPMMYIQKRKALDGCDFGMVFLAGEYLGSYARVGGEASWNTTILHGGKYEPFEADAQLIDLGRRAQAPFALDFTTVDVAISEDGPVVFEVSAFGGFRGAREGIGIDAAGLYVDHVIAGLAERKGD